jgi:hypothetical protein
MFIKKIKSTKTFGKIQKAYLHKDKIEQITKYSENIYKKEYLGNKKSRLLTNIFLRTTYHFSDDKKIDIEFLMDYYNITSWELLNKIYSPINKLCDIQLDTKFIQNINDINVIDIYHFDSIHGDGSLYKLLLNTISSKHRWVLPYQYTGYMSIYRASTIKTIENICKEINNRNYKTLLDEFIINTTHTHNDAKIYIETLMYKYNISSEEILYYMVKNNTPIIKGINIFTKMPNIISIETAKKVLELNNYKINYHNGYVIKTIFKQHLEDRQCIDIKRFDKQNRKSFYYCIISLLNSKL